MCNMMLDRICGYENNVWGLLTGTLDDNVEWSEFIYISNCNIHFTVAIWMLYYNG